jgi:hypothetical protein
MDECLWPYNVLTVNDVLTFGLGQNDLINSLATCFFLQFKIFLLIYVCVYIYLSMYVSILLLVKTH